MVMIRKATQNETRTLLLAMGKIMKESTAGHEENNTEKALNIFIPLIHKGAYYLVAEENNIIIGWVLIGQDLNPISNGLTGGIFNLYIYPPYRKLGLGKTLMTFALSELRDQGFQKVILNVYAGNPAKLLYEELGFRDVSFIMEKDLE